MLRSTRAALAAIALLVPFVARRADSIRRGRRR